MNDSAFEQWYNGMVGFHINSERILYDMYAKEDGYPDPVRLRRWMEVCWNNAIEQAQEEYCTHCGNNLDQTLEHLKEPLDKTL